MRELCRRTLAAVLAAAALLVGAGCLHTEPGHRVLGYRDLPAAPERRAEREMRGSNTDEGRRLADDLMVAAEGLLGDAYVRDNRHLYVRLGPAASADVVPDLVQALVVVMHQQFPDQDVAVHVSDQHGVPLIDASFDHRLGGISYALPKEASPQPRGP